MSEPGPVPVDPSPVPTDHRLHPSTLLFSFARVLRNLLIPAALALFSGRGSIWEWLFFVLFVLTGARAVFRYLTLTWRLGTTELVVREGLLYKRERHVPYTHVQNVDLVQNVFHRLFGVAEVRVETAGGSEPEASLSVLARDDAEALRRRLFAERDGVSGAAVDLDGPADVPARDEGGEVLVAVPPRHLVFLGFVMNRGMAVVAAGFGVLYELGAVETLGRWLGLTGWIDRLIAAGWIGAITQLVLVVTVGLVALFGLSVVWSLVRFWGYTLRLEGEDLRIGCGLLTRVSASVPRRRVQSLTVTESWLHRRFALASMEARTAGGTSAEKSETGWTRSRFVPVLPADAAEEVVRRVLPQVGAEEPAWRSIAPTAARRMRRRSLLLLAVPTVALAIVVSPWTLLATLPLAAVSWVYAGAAARRARWARTSWGLVWQRGVWTRRTTLLPAEKIQTVRLATSPFDRRWGHVTLVVDAAGGTAAAPEILVRCLAAADAHTLLGELAEAASRTEYVVRPSVG